MTQSAQTESSAPWLGPSVKDMLETHTLAANIVARHVDPCGVLDGSELVLLRRFVNAPETYQEILDDCNLLPNPDDKGNPQHGSLVGWVMMLHAEAQGGNGKEPPLADEEILLLKKWFERGQPDAKMEGCCETGKKRPVAEQEVKAKY